MNCESSRGGHVFVISHRRSGTHLLIDAICNNFAPYKRGYVSIDCLTSRRDKRQTLEAFQRRLDKAPRVIKSHTHADVPDFFEQDPAIVDFVEALQSRSKRIYVFRDGRDVLASLYVYVRDILRKPVPTDFGDFIRMTNEFDVLSHQRDMNRIEYWVHHVTGWREKDRILHVSFETLISDYPQTLQKVAQFLDLPLRNRIRNVIRSRNGPGASPSFWTQSRERFYKTFSRYVLKKRISSIAFHKGTVGEHTCYFTDEDQAYFDSIAAELMRELGYYEG